MPWGRWGCPSAAPDGELQRRHLENVDDVDIVIAPMGHEELLDAMYQQVSVDMTHIA